MNFDKDSLGYLLGGALVGSTLGIAAGIFLSPKSGKDLRQDISRRADRTFKKFENCVRDIF